MGQLGQWIKSKIGVRPSAFRCVTGKVKLEQNQWRESLKRSPY